MTSVHLSDLFFHDGTDPSDLLRVPFFPGSTRMPEASGEVRTYAGGYERNVRSRASALSWTPQLGPMPVPTAKALLEREGVPQWVRDPEGGKMLAVFRRPTLTLLGWMWTADAGACPHASVSLVLRRVSGSEVPGAANVNAV